MAADTSTERQWPFVAGERVATRDNWGRAVIPPLASGEYTVDSTTGGGRWLILRGADGRTVGKAPGGIGHGYFRIVGECGEHFPTYTSEQGWHCARCDEPVPKPARGA